MMKDKTKDGGYMENCKSIAGLNVSFREDELTGKFNAIYVNKSIVDSEKFTISRTHKFEYILYKDADEKIERDVPSVSEDILSHLDANGIAKVGEYINDGDIIIGKISFSDEYKTPEERLLFAIFGERTGHDSSIYVPKNISGTITDVLIETPKDNKNLSSNIDKVITVFIRQDFPLQIGDILTDSNNGKGVVVGFFEPMSFDLTDIISNFAFDGTLINRISSVKCDMRARSVEPYSLVNGNPLGSCEFRIPQTITKSDIIKLTKAGMFSVLQDILLCYETKRRVEIYASIATSNHQKDKYDMTISFNNRLRRFLYYIRLLGGKIIFKNSDNDELYNNDNWSFMQLCEKGFETLINQKVYFSIVPEDESFQTYGEVTKPETINYRTTNPEVGGLFCEKIFGTTQNWKCRCGKYKNKRYQGVVCEKCGVVVESNDCRDYKFGHIKLENKYPNPIFPNSKISQVLMLPPNMRPLVKLGNGRFASADINDVYRRILNRNIRIKRMEEYGTLGIIENEIKFFNSSIKAFYNGNKRYKGIFSEIYDWVFQVLFECTVDFSASVRAIINTNLTSGSCCIPYKVALELYEPILLNLLIENKFVKNLKAAKRFINKAENKQVIIDVFNESSCSYKMIALSSAEDGEPIILSAKIIAGYVTELNESDWKWLKLTTGDNVKLFLPITKYSQEVLTSPINLDDKLVNEFEAFLNCFSTQKEVPAEEKRQCVLQAIHHIDGNKKFLNSLLFCLLSGRRITNSERQRCIEEINNVIDLGKEQEQISDDEDKTDDDLEIKLKLFNLNDDTDNDTDEDNQCGDLESLFSLFDDEDDE